MARNLTVREKLEKGARALEMSALGFSKSAIARELDVNRKTVDSLIEVGAEDIDLDSTDLERSRAKAHYQRVIREGWRALRNKNLNVNSHNIPALLSQVTNAQARLDKLNGIESPTHLVHEHRRTVADIARETEGIPPSERLKVVDGGLAD